MTTYNTGGDDAVADDDDHDDDDSRLMVLFQRVARSDSVRLAIWQRLVADLSGILQGSLADIAVIVGY